MVWDIVMMTMIVLPCAGSWSYRIVRSVSWPDDVKGAKTRVLVCIAVVRLCICQSSVNYYYVHLFACVGSLLL